MEFIEKQLRFLHMGSPGAYASSLSGFPWPIDAIIIGIECPNAAISNFIIADRKTDYLLSPSIDEWLNEHHRARFFLELIDQLDLSKLSRQYAVRWRTARQRCWRSDRLLGERNR